jgi:hypothetical protein
MKARRFSMLLALAWVACAAAGAAEPVERDRALLTVEGKVVAVEKMRAAGGQEWIDAVVEPKGQSAVRVRIAPTEILDAEGFRIEVGQRLQAQVFSDEAPFGAQRVRNRDTGRVVRLRCLHGEPLWNPTDPSKGLSPGGGRRGDPGGPRHRGGR